MRNRITLHKIVGITLLTVAFLFLNQACSKKTAPQPDDGQITNNLYKNTFFNFQLQLPNQWYSADQTTMNAIGDRGRDVIAGDDKNMEASLKAAQKNTYNLFMASKVAPGTPIEFNPSITCVAERTSTAPGVKTGKDYLFHVKNILNNGQFKVTFNEDIVPRNIGGKEFFILKAEISLMKQTIKQEYYATMLNGFALAFVANYSGDEEYSLIQQSINSMQFN